MISTRHFIPNCVAMSSLNICSLYQGVYLALTLGKQFQVIHKQQVIQFESLVAPFIASLSSSQQPCQWDHTQNKQQWR